MKKTSLKKLKYKKRFTYLRSIVFDKKTLSQKGVVFEVVKFPPHTSNKQHLHKKTREIFFVESGKSIITFNRKRYQAKSGDIFFCPPNVFHQVINKSPKNFVMLVVKTNDTSGDIHIA